MRTVFAGDDFLMQRDDLLQVVVLRRLAGRLEIDALPAAFAPLTASLSTINRGDWGLLFDMRDAAMRNDEAYERAMGVELARFMSGFRRRALLVKTAVGALQVHRASRSAWNDDVDSAPEVFRDEGEAMQHLHT